MEEDSALPAFEEIDSSDFDIPADYMLPHTASAKEAWMLWWCPAPSEWRCAIRHAAPKDFDSRRCKKTFTAWKSFSDFMLCKLWEHDEKKCGFTNVQLLSSALGVE